jgi:hypothetical protein
MADRKIIAKIKQLIGLILKPYQFKEVALAIIWKRSTHSKDISRYRRLEIPKERVD